MQNYAFSSKPPRKKKEFCKLSANYPISVIYNPITVSYSKLSPGGPSPQNMAKTSDGPPTIKRSGSEHRRAVTSSLFGQERGLVRDVEPSLMGKSDANECNESSLSNCRVQLALSKKKDGMILETPSLTVRK